MGRSRRDSPTAPGARPPGRFACPLSPMLFLPDEQLHRCPLPLYESQAAVARSLPRLCRSPRESPSHVKRLADASRHLAVEVSDEGIDVATAFERKNAVPLRREADPEAASAGQERCGGTRGYPWAPDSAPPRRNSGRKDQAVHRTEKAGRTSLGGG